MGAVPPGGIGSDNRDYALIKHIEAALLNQAGGYANFALDIPQMLRRAIDEVIDAPRTNRFTIDETEKTEKTYLGTKIEILFRNYLKLPKGKILDLEVDGIETDIKNTIGNNWSIPPEAIDHPSILIQCDEKTARCSVGIFVARLEHLNQGQNRDGKRTISRVGLGNVYWLLRHASYPKNFWEALDPKSRAAIMAPSGGTERLAVLFSIVQRKPVSRLLVQAVAQQDDYMKRVRRNGGARDILARQGIAILWGQKDRALIEALGLPPCRPDEFISVRPETPEHVRILRAAGQID